MKIESVNSLNDLIQVIESLPEVKSVNVPTTPTRFCSGSRTIFSTEKEWKQSIIDQCVKVCKVSKIVKFRFNSYYGEQPKSGNNYYIDLIEESGIKQAALLGSGEYGRLD